MIAAPRRMWRARRLTGPDSATARNIAITIQAIGCHSSRTIAIVPITTSTIVTTRMTARDEGISPCTSSGRRTVLGESGVVMRPRAFRAR